MELHDAIKDLRYLLNRGYRKTSSLTFVCNHYQLTQRDRHFLARSVFSDVVVQATLQKKLPLEDIKGKDIAIDGYNVLITTEAVLRNEAILCDDAVLRDISGTFGKYKMTETTDEALKEIYAVLQKYAPQTVTFYFDQQVSHSGDLCASISPLYPCKTTPHVDLVLSQLNLITATSDSILIERLDHFIDIPFDILLSKSL